MPVGGSNKTNHNSIVSAINTLVTNMQGYSADADQYAVFKFWRNVQKQLPRIQSNLDK